MNILSQTNAVEFFKKINFVELSAFFMFFSIINIFVDFFPLAFPTAITALFLPGYLLARLILEKLDYLESIVFGIVLSIGLEVIMVLVLVKVFAFPFNKLTILESALLLCIALIALIELKRFFSEYTIAKE